MKSPHWHARAMILAAMLTAAGSPVAAQAPSGEAAKMLGGPWEFSNADRDKTCTITFRPEQTATGFKLEFDKSCANLFPLVRDIESWKFADNDLLRLLDGKGKSLIEFSEVESGIFEAPTPGIGLLFLQAVGAAGPAPRAAEQVFGDWALMRSAGKPLCTLTLENGSTREGFALKVKPDCDPAIARLGLSFWRMDRGELMLVLALGNSWRFEEVDPATWRRIPEGADPITLVKQ
jgi:hypothetical protein